MEYGIEQFAVLIMKRGKIVKCDEIKMPDNRIIRGLEKEEGYKYLGILEGDEIKSKDMKNIITSEYYRRVRKILKSKLSGGNIMKAINARAVSIVRYGASIIKWTNTELSSMDRKTRKLLTINGVLGRSKGRVSMWKKYCTDIS